MKRNFAIIFGIGLAVLALVFLGYERARAADEWLVLPKDKFSVGYIKRIKVEGDILYIGTANGLNIYDAKADRKTVVQGLPNPYVTAISVSTDIIWVGTPEGLAKVDKRTAQTVQVFTKENSRLPANYITDLVVDGSQLWIGTLQFGVNLFDMTTGNFRSWALDVNFLGTKVNAIALDGQNVWVATEAGLNVYDKSMDYWVGYSPEKGLAFDKVSCLAVDGQYVWAGTSGGGLSRFDKLGSSFFNYTTANGLVDDTIQCLTLDGNYLWIGTFSGVNRFNKVQNEWKVYRKADKELPEESISDIAISGNFAWFGTDGGGLARLDKVIPQAYLSPLTRYVGNGMVEIIGTSYSYQDIVSSVIENRSEIFNQYLKTGITMVKDVKILNGKMADWNVKELVDGTYYLRLTVQDKPGNQNSSQLAFVVDNIPPVVMVDLVAEAVNIANINLSGRYNEMNLVRVYLQKGDDILPAEVTRMTKTWSRDVALSPGLNQFKVVAEDVAGQKTEPTITLIYDTDRPQFTISERETVNSANYAMKGEVRDYALSKVVLSPGDVQVPFTPVENKPYAYEFTANVILNEGENKFTLDAYDKVGNKTSLPIVRMFSGAAGVSFDKTITRVDTKNFVARGTWAGNNVKSITVSNGLTGVKIPALLSQAGGRAFNAALALKDGENILTATVVFGDGTTGFDILPVVCALEASKLTLNMKNYFFSERKVLITGSFHEPNLKEISLLPDNQRAAVDTASNTFQVQTTLKSERNPMTLVMVDKSGRKVQKEFTLVFDETAPVLKVGDLPGIVPFSPVTVKGTYEEKNIARIVATPMDVAAVIDTNTKTFEVRVPLQAGENKIVLLASDKANNESSQPVTVKYVPQAVTALPEGNVSSSDTNIMKMLKYLQEENARLRARPATGGTAGPAVPEKVPMPAGSAVFFVPFDAAGGDSLFTVANDYLGSASYVSLISALNDGLDYSFIAKRRSILLPSRSLVRYLNSQSAFDTQSQLVNAMAMAYNRLGGGRPVEDYYRKLAELLYANDVLADIPPGGSRPLEVNGSLVVITKGPSDDQGWSGLKRAKNYRNVIVGRVEGRAMRFLIL